MASCDMCGKPATTRARIEGSTLIVCANCATFGTELKAPVAPPRTSTASRPRTGPLPPHRAGASQPRAPTQPAGDLVVDAGVRIRAARQRLKLTEEEAAAKLQLHKSTLLHYESGRMLPDDTTARRLERFFGITLFEPSA